MHFLEECRKSEEEGKAGQAKAALKAKAAAATVPPTKQDELTKQLRYQQHQIDALVRQVRNSVSAVRAMQASSSVARPGNPSFGGGGFERQTQGTWRGGSRGRGLSSQMHTGSTPQSTGRSPCRNNKYVIFVFLLYFLSFTWCLHIKQVQCLCLGCTCSGDRVV